MDACVVSHELGKQKPDPDIFNEAMRLAGSIPKNTFYTDDRLDLIEAARVMGIRAFEFTGHESLKENLSKCGIQV
jgi:HAD superfamily hydrolase (TIGR01509 family)